MSTAMMLKCPDCGLEWPDDYDASCCDCGYEIDRMFAKRVVPALDFRFTVLGRPQQRGSKQAVLIPKRGGGWVEKNGRPIVRAKDDNAKSKDWMQEVRSVAHAQWGNRPLIIEPIELTIKFYFARPQGHYGTGKNAMKLKGSAPLVHAQSPDLAKLIRCLEDALTGVVWRDDRQVCRYGTGTGRYWSDSHERAEVMIRVAE